MRTLIQDLRQAARSLRRSPGFTAVALLTLALGIGANSAIFSVVNSVLLQPLPFPDPERLVVVHSLTKGQKSALSAMDFTDLRAQNRVFEEVAAYHHPTYNLTGRGEPVQLPGAAVSAAFFQVLGIQPQLGRTFRAEESEAGQAKVAIFSHGLWRQRFGGDRNFIGRMVTLDAETYTVVGVMPSGFDFPAGREIWTPIEHDEEWLDAENRRAEYLHVVARLAPGVTLQRAGGDVAAIAARLEHAYPETNTGVGLGVEQLHGSLVADLRTPLLLLLGGVAFVLAIACANVGNLLLARAAAREGEIAVRAALGAGRWRLVRQLLTESLVLGALGAGLGLLLAIWGAELLVRLEPRGIPRLDEVGIDRTVVAFTAGLALLSAIAFGVLPALQALRGDLGSALKQSGRGALVERRGARARSLIVVVQTALAVVLLIGAGLLLKSFVRLLRVDPGFRPERVLTFELGLAESSYDKDAEIVTFYDRLLSELGSLPGARSAGAIAGGLPLTGGIFVITFDVEGRPVARPGQEVAMQVRVATPDYFRTMGIPLIRGRGFTAADRGGAPAGRAAQRARGAALLPRRESDRQAHPAGLDAR
jgi:putative ABC transport system permease protein